MKKLMLYVLAIVAMLGSGLRAQEVVGDWQGTLHAGGKDLRLVLSIYKGDKDGLSAKFYSLDQAGGRPFVASSVTRQGTNVKVAIDSIGGTYEGKLSADGKSMVGTWTQGATGLPVAMVKATPETAWDIPAPPAAAKPMAADADPAFDVATIKPNNSGESALRQLTFNGRSFVLRNGSLGDLIGFAYNLQMRQIVGGPDWMNSDRYDIDGVPDKEGAPSVDQMRVMMRKLLADRFALKFHPDKREMAAFVLAVGKGGPKLTVAQGGGTLPGFGMGKGEGGLQLHVMNATMDEFSSFLQMLVLDRPVVNQTALTSRYDFRVTFVPDDSMFNGHPPKVPAETASAPALLDAMGQVGLKLTAEKTQVDVIVIDHVEKPSPN
jgi:uncharacterized protein (TIGR03435 family)